MLSHVLAAAEALAPAQITVVLGPGMDAAAKVAGSHPHVVQPQRRGTADAVACAHERRPAAGDVLVLYGDTPLIAPDTLRRAVARRRAADNPAIVVLGFETDEPGSYGRLRLDDEGRLAAIIEAADADAGTRAIRLCNSGVMVIEDALLWGLLDRVGNDNAKGEYYLTDLVALAAADGRCSAVVRAPQDELCGVNSRAELAAAEAALQWRLRAQAMAGGATLIQPDAVRLAADTVLGRDVTIEPNVFFGPGVAIADGVTIRAFSHLEGVRVGRGTVVGPFVRLRPGSVVGEGARVGNFVEVKASAVDDGAKISHLSYVGDARVGAGANIGAGVITCNYDGAAKHHTEIGAGAFIGSNTALIAPITVGAGAMIGAGSTLAADVAADALAVTRAGRKVIAGGAARYRRKRGG